MNILTISGASKRFGGIQALSEISLKIERHIIYGLIGPNGAGKSTLFNVITGLCKPDAGLFVIDGKTYFPSSMQRVAQVGIARTFQNIRLFPKLTALENVMIGRHIRSKTGILGALLRLKKTKDEESSIRETAYQTLRFVGIAQHCDQCAKTLSYGDQRRLEVARALALEPKLIALDEPAAGMNPTEKLELSRLLLKIKKTGITILMIEHDVRLVINLCNRIAVLECGKLIAEGTPEKIKTDQRVIEAYLGKT